jgi:hypothetical protein
VQVLKQRHPARHRAPSAGRSPSTAAPPIAPGLSPGQINTGNLALAGIAQFEILGPALGTQYDNINVTGTVNVTGATLAAHRRLRARAGRCLFRLITNDGAMPSPARSPGCRKAPRSISMACR